MRSSLQALLCETRRAALALAEAADENLAPMGVTSGQRALLETLAREKQPLTPLALARKQLVSLDIIDATLTQLSLRSWVGRPSGAGLGRDAALVLTPAGHAFLADVHAAEARLLRRLESELGEQTIGSTMKALRQLRKCMPKPAVTALAWSGR